MSESPQPQNQHIYTGGGAYISGSVDTGGGDFVGRDKIVVNNLEDVPLPPEEVNNLLAQYRQRLLAETRYVKLEGIPIPDESLASTIPLQRIYIHIQALEQRESQKLRRDEEQALFESAKDKQEKSGRLDLFDLISRFGEYIYRRGESVESSQRPDPVDPLKAIREHKHLVLLGAPGSGKSTLLRYLANQMSKDEQGKIPVLVFLGAYALAYRQDRQLSLREWAIYNAAPDNNDLRRALRQAAGAGQVLWLLDGLDEAGDLREETSRQIGHIASRDQAVVTSRPLDYRRTNLESFAHFEALPLTTANVGQFISDWLTILAEQQRHTPEWVKECSDWLRQQLRERPQIQALTQNPLLLTFLVILARHDPRHDLPNRRSELYRRYVEELFSAWEQRRRTEAIKLPKVLYMQGIESIAWYLHLAYFGRSHDETETKSVKNAPDRDYLRMQLANALRSSQSSAALVPDVDEMAGQIIDFWINTGLIEERQWQQWKLVTFRHLTFQEYGVANVLHSSWQRSAKRTWQFLKPRLHHFAWRESLLLLTEQMDTPAIDRLLNHLLRHPSAYDRTLQRDLYLAVTLVKDSNHISEPIIQQIRRQLTRRAKSRSFLFTYFYIGGLILIDTYLLSSSHLMKVLPGYGDMVAGFLLYVLLIYIRFNPTLCAIFLLPIRVFLNHDQERLKAEETLRDLDNQLATELKDKIEEVHSYTVEALLKDKIYASEALGRLGNERSIEPLSTALNDEDEVVHQHVVKALGRLGNERAIEPLITALNNENKDVRRYASEALKRLGNERVVESLIAVLNDEDEVARACAAEALGKFNDTRIIEPLANALKDNNMNVRKFAALWLGERGDQRSVDHLIDLLNYGNASDFGNAALLLGQLKAKRSIRPLLAAALRDHDEDVRCYAVHALGRLGNELAVEPLIIALSAKDRYVREYAAEALGRLGNELAVEPLIIALSAKDSSMRKYAAEALGQLGDERAAEPLIIALEDEDYDVRVHAAEALVKLGGKRVIDSLVIAFKSKDIYILVRVIKMLQQLGDKRAVELLIIVLDAEDSNVRKYAAEALGQLGDERAVEPLIIALKDEDDGVCRLAAEALGQLGDERAIKPLVMAVLQERSSVHMFALEALQQLGDERAVEPLIVALKDAKSYIRVHAAKALGQLGNKRAVEPLIVALKDEDNGVRVHAAEALGQLGNERAVEPLIVALKTGDKDVRSKAAAAIERLSQRRTINLTSTKSKKIISNLWWQLTDPFTEIDEAVFSAFASVVRHLPVTASIDDLLLPAKPTSRHQLRWWLGAFSVAVLALAVSAGTGVLGNLLTDWLNIGALSGLPLAIAVALLVIVSLVLLIISQVTSNNSQ